MLSDRDQATASLFAERLLDGGEPAVLKLAARTAPVALDRWGLGLLDGHDRPHESFHDAVEVAAYDVLAHYSDDDARVDGVDGLVFEGQEVTTGLLVDATLDMIETVEAAGAFDRDEPGGLVEEVEP